MAMIPTERGRIIIINSTGREIDFKSANLTKATRFPGASRRLLPFGGRVWY
jgi:hypothetical protein